MGKICYKIKEKEGQVRVSTHWPASIEFLTGEAYMPTGWTPEI